MDAWQAGVEGGNLFVKKTPTLCRGRYRRAYYSGFAKTRSTAKTSARRNHDFHRFQEMVSNWASPSHLGLGLTQTCRNFFKRV